MLVHSNKGNKNKTAKVSESANLIVRSGNYNDIVIKYPSKAKIKSILELSNFANYHYLEIMLLSLS